MKRKAKDLGIDCDVSKNVNVMKNNIEEATDGKKKKIKFEKSLNKKPTGKSESVKIIMFQKLLYTKINKNIFSDKNVKKPSIKKDLKGKSLKVVTRKTTSENTDSTDSEKKKKVKFEKSLNKKSIGKNKKVIVMFRRYHYI